MMSDVSPHAGTNHLTKTDFRIIWICSKKGAYNGVRCCIFIQDKDVFFAGFGERAFFFVALSD
jgi:hypothetical protein